MKFSKQITSVHQVEITSRCNLRCRYCPSPKLPRPKVDMTEQVFERTVGWAKVFVRRGTQFELNLAGIGESTMHPKFIDFVGYARKELGPAIALTMATNGLLVTEEMAEALVPYHPMIWVSLHRPEKAGPAVEILKKHKLLSGISADPSLQSIDWAGQVQWHVSTQDKGHQCTWVKQGRVFIMADGRISACCLDATGNEVIGNVMEEDLTKLNTTPYSLCATCHLDVGVPMQ